MKESNWIDVNDRLPDGPHNVLVTANDIVSQWVEVLQYFDGRWLFTYGDLYPAIVTHWMPLPKPHGEK